MTSHMTSIVREYRERDFDQVLSISDTVYAKRTGSFSLVTNLLDSRMLKKYVVTDEKERITGYGLIWEQRKTSPYILKVEILFHPEYEIVEMLFDKIIEDIQAIGPCAIQARMFHDQTLLLQVYGKYEYAKRMGYTGIFTSTRNTNAPMEAVNRKLGWHPTYSEVRLEKYSYSTKATKERD